MSNSIETAIAIAFFGTIAIGIAIAHFQDYYYCYCYCQEYHETITIDIDIAKGVFQLLLLVLLRQFQNYCSSIRKSFEHYFKWFQRIANKHVTVGI